MKPRTQREIAALEVLDRAILEAYGEGWDGSHGPPDSAPFGFLPRLRRRLLNVLRRPVYRRKRKP